MTVTDRLREAIEKYGTPLADNRVVLNLDDVPRIAYRAGIEAAIAVQPVPTDAEIEQAIDRYGEADICYKECSDDINYGDGAWESSVAASRGSRDKARANLFRLIAAQRSAAQREALEAVKSELRSRIENYPQFDESGRLNALYPGNDIACKMMIRHIDTMLAKEDGDE